MQSEIMEVTIESNVEIPVEDNRGRWRKEKIMYPVNKLGVKESFWICKEKSSSLRCTASRFKRLNPGWNYTVRSEKNDGKDGCRIWRTA